MLDTKSPEVIYAQTGGGYDLTWNTIGVGQSSTGGGYKLSGSAGQSSVNLSSGSDYTLGSGFFGEGAVSPLESVYLPLIVRAGSPAINIEIALSDFAHLYLGVIYRDNPDVEVNRFRFRIRSY
jgi:hypothetical protein